MSYHGPRWRVVAFFDRWGAAFECFCPCGWTHMVRFLHEADDRVSHHRVEFAGQRIPPPPWCDVCRDRGQFIGGHSPRDESGGWDPVACWQCNDGPMPPSLAAAQGRSLVNA